MSAAGLAVFAAPWVEIEHRPRAWERWLFGWRPRTIRLSPVRMGALDSLLRIIGPAMSGDDAAALECLALSSGERPEVLRTLPRPILATAIRAFMALHSDVLAAPDDPGEPSPWTWADHAAVLLGAGHTMADILGYTLAQFRAHLTAAYRAESRRQGLAIVAGRMQWASGEDAARVISELLLPTQIGSPS